MHLKVIVLAGGFGTRLRPWTTHRAKPLLPMLDRTLLERVVEALPDDLVDEVLVAAGYGIEQMREHFASIETPYPVKIVEEFEPLGTGGAIGNCRDRISDTFCVMNGDLLSSVPVAEMLEYHRSQGKMATISLWEVEDPSRFGVADFGDDGLIRRFQEKPPREEAFSNMINAGCYILEPAIFEQMPEGAHSMERDVFTRIASVGQLSGFSFEGHFVDAGTPASWIEGMHVCLEGQRWSSGTAAESGSWMGEGADCDGTLLRSAVGAHSSIDAGSEITDSSLLSGVVIGAGAKITRCLIGENANIGADANLSDVVVDYGAEIPAGHSQHGGTYPESE